MVSEICCGTTVTIYEIQVTQKKNERTKKNYYTKHWEWHAFLVRLSPYFAIESKSERQSDRERQAMPHKCLPLKFTVHDELQAPLNSSSFEVPLFELVEPKYLYVPFQLEKR